MRVTMRSGVRARAAVVGLALLAACASGSDQAEEPYEAPSTTTTTLPLAAEILAACPTGLATSTSGTVASAAMIEISGLAASRSQPGVVWAVNDSGDAPRVFAISPDGALLASFVLDGVTATDWEDIAAGPGPVVGESYLYIGDIGDNAGGRDQFSVVRVPEPAVDRAGPARVDEPLAGAETFGYSWPDRPRDTEALMVDPTDGAVYLVHKNWSGTGEAQVVRVPIGEPGTSAVLEPVTTIALEPGKQVTGADIAPEGDAIVVRTYGDVHLYARPERTAVRDALAVPPCTTAAPEELQGESVTFAGDGRSLFTTSEGTNPELHVLQP